MKTALLAIVVGLAPLAVYGQECAQNQAGVQAYSAQPAPAPGHPLDPNDVAILTGHAADSTAARSAYARSTVVYGYTQPYSFGMGQGFGFTGFFPRSRRFGAPFFRAPFGPFFFSGSASGWR